MTFLGLKPFNGFLRPLGENPKSLSNLIGPYGLLPPTLFTLIPKYSPPGSLSSSYAVLPPVSVKYEGISHPKAFAHTTVQSGTCFLKLFCHLHHPWENWLEWAFIERFLRRKSA